MNMAKKVLVAGVFVVIAGIWGIASADCPQERKTKKAPDDIFNAINQKNSPNDIAAGKELYQNTAKPVRCSMCHGKRGRGNGPAAKAFRSPKEVRDFACRETMKGVSDGQMFWITKYGSLATGMTEHPMLSDDEIWQIVAYIRSQFMR